MSRAAAIVNFAGGAGRTGAPAIPTPSRSNCLVWALTALWHCHGYVLFRWSDNWRGCHFMWSPDLKQLWAYLPTEPGRVSWDYFWFRGRIRRERR